MRYGDDPTSLPESWHDIAVTTTHPVPGLTNGIEYTFEVRAVAGAYPGAPASVTAMPGNRAPVNLEATIDNGTVVLTWEAPTADVASVTSYHFHYSLSSDGVNVMRHGIFGTPDVDTRTVDTIARERGYPYIAYKVLASRGEEFSDWSNTVTVMFDAGPPPEGLNAAAGVGQVTLTWDDPGDTDISGYQYHRYRGSRPGNPEWMDIDPNDAAARRHIVTGLTNGTVNTFEVRAVNATGPGARASVTVTLPPDAPAGLEASPGDGQATLTWDDPGDTDISGYQYHRYRGSRPGNPEWMDIDPNDAAARRHIVTGLTNGTVNTFEVRAVNATGPGARASVTVTLPPDAPAGLEASPGDGQATLTWDDPGDTDISGYQYHRYRGSRPANPVWVDIDPNDAAARRHIVTGLTNGTVNTFEVRANAGTEPGPPAAATVTLRARRTGGA